MTLAAWRLATCVIAVLVGLAVWCAPAEAHARLQESDPAEGETLQRVPEQVRLRFSEPVDAEFSPLEVYDEQGDRVDGDDARMDPDDARVLLVSLEDLAGGPYTVRWRVTSIDGHVIDGEYGFEADSAAAGGEGTGERAASRDEQGPAAQSGFFGHYGHFVGLGIGLLVMAALVLLRRRP